MRMAAPGVHGILNPHLANHGAKVIAIKTNRDFAVMDAVLEAPQMEPAPTHG